MIPGLAVFRYLRGAAAALADARAAPVWLVNVPGFGAAAAPRTPLSVGAAASALAHRLSASGRSIDRLIGHSTGVLAACAAAARIRVRQLVLVGPVIDPRQRSLPRFAAGWAVAGPREPLSLLATEIPEWWSNRRRLWPYLRSCLKAPLEPLLDAAVAANADAGPSLIVRGERDALCSHDWAAQLADRAGGRLVTVHGGSHAFMYRRPDRLVQALS